MVTSFRTPSPATMMPQSTTEVRDMSGAAAGEDVVVLGADAGQVGPVSGAPAQQGGRHQAEQGADQGGQVRAEKPWAA